MTTILYPERRYPNDWIEREILGRRADIRIRDVPHLAQLTNQDRDGVTTLVLHALAATEADIAAFPALRHILRTGPATIEPSTVPIHDITGHATAELADHSIAMALALLRGLIPGPPPRRASGLTLAILGLGRVGTAVALRAKAFGFNIVFHDPHAPPGIEDAIGIARARTLQALLLKADILTIQTPDLPGLIGLAELSILPHGALVVNTTHGTTLNLAAVQPLLDSGQIAAAALDLVDGETAPNGVLVTRHAAHSPDATDALRRLTAEAVVRLG